MTKTSFLAIFVGVFYLIGAALPLSTLWYVPGEVRVQNAQQGTAPEVEFTRHIKRATSIEYGVVIRNEAGDVVCDGNAGPFTYQPVRGPLLDKDLVWWAAGDPRCGLLGVGTYWGETTWTAVEPLASLLPWPLDGVLGWLLPPKRVTRVIPPFHITGGQP